MFVYVVYGTDTGILGEYKTLEESKKAIKEVNEFDMREVGENDTWEIVKEEI